MRLVLSIFMHRMLIQMYSDSRPKPHLSSIIKNFDHSSFGEALITLHVIHISYIYLVQTLFARWAEGL